MRDLRGRNPNGTRLEGREADTMLMAADDTAKLRGRSCCRLPAASARTPTGTGRPAEPAVPPLTRRSSDFKASYSSSCIGPSAGSAPPAP